VSVDRRAVIAIGGNALILDGQQGSIAEQYENARETARHIARLAATGWDVVVTHGNGPQVGFILLRSELVPDDAPIPKLSLEMSVADSQGGIGHILGQALLNELGAAGMPDRVVSSIRLIRHSGSPPSRSGRSTRRRRPTIEPRGTAGR
jgi:carbamate kinase